MERRDKKLPMLSHMPSLGAENTLDFGILLILTNNASWYFPSIFVILNSIVVES